MTTLGRNTLWLRIGAVVALGVLLTGIAFRVARVLEDQRIARELQIGGADRVAAVQRGLNEQLRLLESVGAYRTVSEGMGYADFRAFVTPLFPEGSQLAAIGWAPMVASDERLAVEEAARGEGLTGFRIAERGADGALVPVTPRDFYVPVLYIEPLAGNEPAVGFDLASEKNRRSVLEATRDSGLPHTTRRLRLVQEQRPRSGLLSALAVYRRGAVLDTIDDRRRALVGFITQVFWIDEMIEAGLASLLPGGIDLYFLDQAEGVHTPPIYVHSSRTRVAGQSARTWSPGMLESAPGYVGLLDVGGREWSVVCVPAPGFVTARRGPLPWFLLAVGLLATMLSVMFFAATARRTQKLRQAHADLQESEERLRNVVENMPVLMSALDASGNIVAWNKECERVVGYAADEVLGGPKLLDHLYPTAARRELHAGGLSLDDYLSRERTLIAKDGTERTISWSNLSNSIPIPGWASWHIGIDVTDRNRADREREGMHAQLLQSQKLESLGLLAGGVAHDFNNLLTVIMGNASLALETTSAASPARAALNGVVEASERATLLTQQLLAYTGRGALEMQAIDLSRHVREIGNLLHSTMPKRVVLSFDLGMDLPAVDADPAQLQQLIMNLVLNGAEAIGERPGTVTVCTGIQDIDEDFARSLRAGGELEPGTYVYLEVQDDGHGMDAETRARIFDPFFSTKFTGRGLGLAAALGIVRGHGGSMKVDSTSGAGSVFKVFLPASSRPADRRPKTREKEQEGTGLILVVDDEPMILRLATRALKKLGYRVLTAADGLAAVEIFRARGTEIDCVLLDMTMPKLDGAETFRALRSLRPDVIAILSSGYDEKAATRRLEGKGPAGFLQKPYTALELGAKIRAVLAGRRGTQPVATAAVTGASRELNREV